VHHWVRENFEHILAARPDAADDPRIRRLQQWSEREYLRLLPDFQQRREQGAIRECHGDLHLGNITRIDGRVTPFDCIEFNPALRWIDVISEVAFLVMDLEDRGYPQLGWRFLNGYLQHSGDYAGLPLLRYYLVYRALVRAKVAALRGAQSAEDAAAYRGAAAEYQRYIELAGRYITPPPAALLLMYGLSGSGKSTIAAALSVSPGMIQLRSDIERKRLARLAAGASSGSATAAGIYTAEWTAATYARLLELSSQVIGAGLGVIVDATFLKRSERERFSALADGLKVSCLLLQCKAGVELLEQRVRQRSARGGDASEATLEVLHNQLHSAEAPRDDEGCTRLPIDTTAIDLDAVRRAVGTALSSSG
jgi:predicted kinase